MDKIILVRPPEHNKSSGLLTGEGHGKIVFLANNLKEIIGKINRLNITILSSPEICARETSKTLLSELCASFKVSATEYILLGKQYKTSTEYNERIAKLVEQTEKEKIDILIIVTHNDQINSFPDYFSKTRLWRACSFKSLEPGEALILNFKKAVAMTINQPFNIFV